MRSLIEHAQRVQAQLRAEREAEEAAARKALEAEVKARLAAEAEARATERAADERRQALVEGRLKTCLGCKQEFLLSKGEALFFSSHRLLLPKRCAACRDARRTERERRAGVARPADRARTYRCPAARPGCLGFGPEGPCEHQDPDHGLARALQEADMEYLDMERALARGDDL